MQHAAHVPDQARLLPKALHATPLQHRLATRACPPCKQPSLTAVCLQSPGGGLSWAKAGGCRRCLSSHLCQPNPLQGDTWPAAPACAHWAGALHPVCSMPGFHRTYHRTMVTRSAMAASAPTLAAASAHRAPGPLPTSTDRPPIAFSSRPVGCLPWGAGGCRATHRSASTQPVGAAVGPPPGTHTHNTK